MNCPVCGWSACVHGELICRLRKENLQLKKDNENLKSLLSVRNDTVISTHSELKKLYMKVARSEVKL